MSEGTLTETGTQRADSPHVLLAIDTAIGTSVALGVGGEVFTAFSDDPRSHAEEIGELIARVFAESGVPTAAVTAVVAGSGPGPFTGLRVGMAAAHAFAAGRQVPLYSLHGHEAVALQEFNAGVNGPVRVVQDARRRELFVTSFSGLDADGLPVVTVPAHLQTRESFVASAADIWPERIPAAQLVELGLRRLEAGRVFESDEALYLRAPDVRQPGPPKRVVA